MLLYGDIFLNTHGLQTPCQRKSVRIPFAFLNKPCCVRGLYFSRRRISPLPIIWLFNHRRYL